MIIVLNGPIGIGKTTLAEALTEAIDACAMLSGDHLIAVNPPSTTELELLHSTIALLVSHHRRFGYRNFVIEHVWHTESELADLTCRLDDPDVHCFLLTLPLDENLRRIDRRQSARAIDERAFEHLNMAEERRVLERSGPGTRFDVSRPPDHRYIRHFTPAYANVNGGPVGLVPSAWPEQTVHCSATRGGHARLEQRSCRQRRLCRPA